MRLGPGSWENSALSALAAHPSTSDWCSNPPGGHAAQRYSNRSIHIMLDRHFFWGAKGVQVAALAKQDMVTFYVFPICRPSRPPPKEYLSKVQPGGRAITKHSNRIHTYCAQ